MKKQDHKTDDNKGYALGYQPVRPVIHEDDRKGKVDEDYQQKNCETGGLGPDCGHSAWRMRAEKVL